MAKWRIEHGVPGNPPDIPSSQFKPPMTLIGLLNAAVCYWTWGQIVGAAQRGLLLALTEALSGGVAGVCLGAIASPTDWLMKAGLAFDVGLINALVWAVGGATGPAPRVDRRRPRYGEGRTPSHGKMSLRQILVVLVILLPVAAAVAAFDRAFLSAYTLGGGFEVAVMNAGAFRLTVLGIWVAWRLSDGRAGGIIPLVIVLIVLLALITLVKGMFMLGKITEPPERRIAPQHRMFLARQRSGVRYGVSETLASSRSYRPRKTTMPNMTASVFEIQPMED
jgi:hypothetical protein